MTPDAVPEVVARRFLLHARGAEETTATFDTEGRLLSFRLGGEHYRRGLDGTVVAGDQQEGTPARFCRVEDGEAVLRRLQGALGDLQVRATTERARKLAARAERGLETLWAEDIARFGELLGCVPIVPPLHVRSVVLRLTEGCAYGGCRFCTLYDRIPFRVRDEHEWQEHVRDVLDWLGEGAGLRSSLWIGDASILEAGHARLLRALDDVLGEVRVLAAGAPESALASDPRAFEGIYAFADVPRCAKLHEDTGRALAERGVTRLYLGLESGHRPLLRGLRKPHDGRQVAEAVRRLHDAGISVGLVVLVGAGGRDFAEAHHRDTVALVETLDLRPNDMLLVSPLDVFARASAAAGADPLAVNELAVATDRITADLQAVLPRGVRAADYGIEGFVY